LKQVLILLAHGSRDPRWKLPVERLCRALRSKLHGIDVSLAYLERSRRDLESQVGVFAELGFRRLTIVPVFIGSGRHLKRDLTKKVKVLRRRHQSLRIVVQRAIGEQPRVMAAIASAIAAGTASPRRSARRS
jgi:sirohydrochlorin cobaltochelatase